MNNVDMDYLKTDDNGSVYEPLESDMESVSSDISTSTSTSSSENHTGNVSVRHVVDIGPHLLLAIGMLSGAILLRVLS